MISNFIFLVIIVIGILYIYDRNIQLLDNINISSIKYILQEIFKYIDTIIYPEYEAFNTQQESELIKQVTEKLPECNCLNKLFKQLDQEIKNTNPNKSNPSNNNPFQYHVSKQVRKDYYSTEIYKQIAAVLSDDMPHHQMTYLLDVQHKILKIIHDFIFTTSGSNIPNTLQKLESDFKLCFDKINKKLIEINNDKFIYNDGEKNINTNSGFILTDGSDPLPKNTYYDNFNYY